MTAKHRQLNRFLVWREYHRLVDELDRIPTCQEIADEIGLGRDGVRYHALALNLELRTRGGQSTRDPIDPFDEHEPDLIELLGLDND